MAKTKFTQMRKVLIYIKKDFSRNEAQTSEMLCVFISLILLWNMDIVLEWY